MKRRTFSCEYVICIIIHALTNKQVFKQLFLFACSFPRKGVICLVIIIFFFCRRGPTGPRFGGQNDKVRQYVYICRMTFFSWLNYLHALPTSSFLTSIIFRYVFIYLLEIFA